MKNRIKITLNDEQYMLVKGKWLDSHFIEAPLNVAIQLTEQIFNNGSVDDFTNEELEVFLMGFKDQGLTTKALDVADVLYERFAKVSDMSKLRWLMPITTSLLRLSKVPQKAIEFYTLQVAKLGSAVESPPLYTSVAAAYCDVGDYVSAKRLCDRAYAFGGPSLELSAVYERIKKETF